MSDVKLFQTVDGGDIDVVNGSVTMSPGLETIAYLCLFGGDRRDDLSQNNPYNWWGNLDETDPAKRYRSRTQYLLESIPLTTNNLKRVKDAAVQDLSVVVSEGYATSVSVDLNVPDLNHLDIIITITAEGNETQFTFTEAWKASA